MKFYEIDDNNDLELKFLGEFYNKSDLEDEFDDFNDNNVFTEESLLNLKNEILEVIKTSNENQNTLDANSLIPYFGLNYEYREVIQLGFFEDEKEFWQIFLDEHWCIEFSLVGSLDEMNNLVNDIDKCFISNEDILNYFKTNETNNLEIN